LDAINFMPHLLIPELGEELYLIEDWKPTIHAERRNAGLFINLSKHRKEQRELDRVAHQLYLSCSNWTRAKNTAILNDAPDYERWESARKKAWAHDLNKLDGKTKKTVVFPAGTVLQVDRIYIRKGAADFSSITFKVKNFNGNKGITRFWVKLEVANGMKFNFLTN